VSTVTLPQEPVTLPAGGQRPVDRTPPEGVEKRRLTGERDSGDVIIICGALAAAVSLTSVLATRVLPGINPIGFVVISYLLFLVVYALMVSLRHDAVAVRDRVASVVVHGLAVLALLALIFVVTFTFWQGWRALVHLNFFTQDMRQAGPLEPLEVGGVLHAMTGTLIEISIALVVTVPLGLACAVYLNEVRGPFARFVRTIVEAMTALPSVVAGLFVYAAVILTFGLPKSGLAAGLAISVMMLPIVIRAADVVIRIVPGSLREAALATGATRWRTVWHVVLPTARSGLTTAVLLGTARGIGETAPVLITAGFASTLNRNPLEGPMVSLPLLTYILWSQGTETMIIRAFGAASVLLILVFVLFALARVFGGRPPGQLTNRQRRRRVRASQRDLARFTAGGTP
jgi:phosphate transport system permease protein